MPQLPYHEFPRLFAHGDKIHSLRQIGHVNMLGFGIEAARQDGLAHEVGDVVGLVL